MEALRAVSLEAETHFRSICAFTDAKPMRAAVDRQTFDDLKPGTMLSFEVMRWAERLTQAFVDVVATLAQGPGPSDETARALLAEALDAFVLIECQYAGWSQCMNRFSWFKRTQAALGAAVADDPDMETIRPNISAFQSFIGNAQYPIGLHLTGPLRSAVKKVSGHERVLLAAVSQATKQAMPFQSRPPDRALRPLPMFLVLADGDLMPGSFNVFSPGKDTIDLRPTQQLFKRFPEVEVASPLHGSDSSAAAGCLKLAVVLQRCPHYSQSMGSKWGAPSSNSKKCVLQ